VPVLQLVLQSWHLAIKRTWLAHLTKSWTQECRSVCVVWVTGRVICGTRTYRWDSTIFNVVCNVSKKRNVFIFIFDPWEWRSFRLVDPWRWRHYIFLKGQNHVTKDTMSYLKGLDFLLPCRKFWTLKHIIQISGFRHGINEIFAFQGCYAVLIGS
jgi:hypothetical protein